MRLEGQLTLSCDKEQARLKGVAPSAEPEAHQALRQGKLPSQARVRVATAERTYAFTFLADALALAAVKIPERGRLRGRTSSFYERMYLVEELEALSRALYAKFVAVRLSPAWEEHVLPAVRAWVKGEPTLHPDVYAKLRARVPPLRAPVRPKTAPPPTVDAEAAHRMRMSG